MVKKIFIPCIFVIFLFWLLFAIPGIQDSVLKNNHTKTLLVFSALLSCFIESVIFYLDITPRSSHEKRVIWGIRIFLYMAISWGQVMYQIAKDMRFSRNIDGITQTIFISLIASCIGFFTITLFLNVFKKQPKTN